MRAANSLPVLPQLAMLAKATSRDTGRGGGRLRKMDDQTSLDRLQAHCKWERSAYEARNSAAWMGLGRCLVGCRGVGMLGGGTWDAAGGPFPRRRLGRVVGGRQRRTREVRPCPGGAGQGSRGPPFSGDSLRRHIGKNCSQWKDYRLTFSFRLPEPTADGAQLLRVIVRGPAANIWGGYNVYLFNAGGKFKIQANVWPTNPSATTPVAVDSQWHRLSIRVLGQELEAELDDRGDARLAATDVYDASTVGGIYLGFSPGKWQLADVRVVALRPILEAADVLARYCLFAYYPSLDKLAVKADLGECSDQPWARRVTAIRFAVHRQEKDTVLAQGEISAGRQEIRHSGGAVCRSCPRASTS